MHHWSHRGNVSVYEHWIKGMVEVQADYIFLCSVAFHDQIVEIFLNVILDLLIS